MCVPGAARTKDGIYRQPTKVGKQTVSINDLKISLF